MNLKERASMVKAMDFIAQRVNNEDILWHWLALGVADEDINEFTSDEELTSYFENDGNFAELMDTFLFVMTKARNDGGLYCDRICSIDEEK